MTSAASEPLGPPQEAVPERLRALGIRPQAALYLTEPARGIVDGMALTLATPWLAAAPRGDGRGVLVLPGLLASDRSTRPLRSFLRHKGHYVRGWRLGRNIGPTSAIVEGMPEALRDLAERTGGPVSVVGWSLGGLYARYLAKRYPEDITQVITLGSPVGVSDGHRTHADLAFNRLSFLHAHGADVPRRADVGGPVPVPSTSVYSRLDGVVSWRACLTEGDQHQNVEVHCSHLGFGVDPATLWLVADRLAQPPGTWRPFQPAPFLRPFYPSL